MCASYGQSVGLNKRNLNSIDKSINIIPDSIETINTILDGQEHMLDSMVDRNVIKIKKIKYELRNTVDMLKTDFIPDLESELKHLKEHKHTLIHNLEDTKLDLEKLKMNFPEEISQMKQKIDLQNILSTSTNGEGSSDSKSLTSMFVQIGRAAKKIQEKLHFFDG